VCNLKGHITFNIVKVKVKVFYLAKTNMFIAINNTKVYI